MITIIGFLLVLAFSLSMVCIDIAEKKSGERVILC